MKCSYCWTDFDEQREYKEMSEETYSLMKEVLKTHSKRKSLDIIISGGEPTLYKNIQKVCEELSEYPLMLITNGIEKDVILSLPTTTKIRLSYHANYDYDEFIEFMNILRKTHYVEVVCPLDPSILQKCLDLMNYCKERDITFEVCPIISNVTHKHLDYQSKIEETFNYNNILYYNPLMPYFFDRPLNAMECYKKSLTQPQRKSICMIPHFEIETDGTVIPSCMVREQLMRSLNDSEVFQQLHFCNHTSCLSERGCGDLVGWRV
jgi:organic radical activating enzyme